ncbi:DUF2723 domain-containing protein [Chloroflexota bacterium]
MGTDQRLDGGTRLRAIDWAVAVLLFAGGLALYLRTLAPTVLAGDGGEFQFVPYLLGVAHPTGYPLYNILGWAWTHVVPVGDVAYRMNLFSAFWAALAVGLLYPAARALMRQSIPGLDPVIRRLVAILAALIFAVTPTFWSQAIIAEVYSLHIVLMVSILYLFLTWGETGKAQFLLLGAGFFGLGLSHHSTTVLLAPALLVYALLVDRRLLSRGRLILGCLALALAPLVLYLYIPLRAPHTDYLRLALDEGRELVLYQNTLAKFVSFVLGGPFGGSVDLSVDLGARLNMAWAFALHELSWLGLLTALVGVVRLAVSRRFAVLALTGLSYLATWAFNLVYTIGDIYVLFIPAHLILVLWLAVGVGTLVEAVTRVWERAAGERSSAQLQENSWTTLPGFLRRFVLVLPFFALVLWTAATNYHDIDQSQNRRARTRWEAILAEPLPSDAVLVSNDRNNIMPMWYFQYVDGLNPGWLGLYPLITPDFPALGNVLDLALSTGRPVYLIKEMPGVEVKVMVEPEGRLWHVLGQAAANDPAHPKDLQLGDAVAMTGYDRSPHSPHPGDVLEVDLYWQALRPLGTTYHSYVHLVDDARQLLSQSDRQPGGVYYPSTLWQTGEKLLDKHELTVPSEAPPGVYRLLAGMYELAADGSLEPLGQSVEAGQIAIKSVVQTTPSTVSHPANANLADQIELVGYDVVHQDGELVVTLHWRGIQPPAANYTVFVHLLDADGSTISQHDGQPQGGAYPTSVWDADEMVVDEHTVPLPPGLVPGAYRLRVGLYSAETGERLPVDGAGDSVELGPVEVGE